MCSCTGLHHKNIQMSHSPEITYELLSCVRCASINVLNLNSTQCQRVRQYRWHFITSHELVEEENKKEGKGYHGVTVRCVIWQTALVNGEQKRTLCVISNWRAARDEPWVNIMKWNGAVHVCAPMSPAATVFTVNNVRSTGFSAQRFHMWLFGKSVQRDWVWSRWHWQVTVYVSEVHRLPDH